MDRKDLLIERLIKYKDSGVYPFHMPGHKRLAAGQWTDFPNPFTIDITEIDGFDNLHHPEGILKHSMEWAAGLYGSDRTYYLVNGSSCGILTAISSAARPGGRILMARNCHQSAYHGVFLNRLETEYLYPQILPELGIQGGISPHDVERALDHNRDAKAVLIVSPTYEGVVSDIQSISQIVHEAGLPLIVDEAHGAHFRYAEEFPVPALDLGADVVIQSVHKTLPSLTQSALLHVRLGYVDIGRIEQYLSIYQSSSPSYLLMASIENCIYQMEQDKRERMFLSSYLKCLSSVRKRLSGMKRMRLLDKSTIDWDLAGNLGVKDLDMSKIVVSTRGTGLTGASLCDILRQACHLEMEMCGADYATAITTIMDSRDGLERLCAALLETDAKLAENEKEYSCNVSFETWNQRPEVVLSLWETFNRKREVVELEESRGRISAEYVYTYPPGIPIVAPGERISQQIIEKIQGFRLNGLPVQGLKDYTCRQIEVIGI